MIIQCTKKLLDKLAQVKKDLVLTERNDADPDNFYAWHANLVSINRRKAIIFMNNLTRYTIVLYRPKAKDTSKVEESLKEGIKAAFAAEGIKESVIEKYLQKSGDCRFSKTANRSIVANLNEVCRQVSWFEEYLDENKVIQDNISLKMGRFFLNYEGEYNYPNEQLFRALCKMIGSRQDEWNDILEVENYQLKIKLDLEKFDIWRRILIPAGYTFADLHQVIQIVFGWFGYHLHEFYVKDKSDASVAGSGVVRIRIVDGCDPGVCDYLEPDKYTVLTDTKTKLKDIFEETKECFYSYDFGDGWEHIITLEKVSKEVGFTPVLLERKGKRPPEDVGGEGGFETYMEIISNENDPQYTFMTQWAKETEERECSIEQINLRLKR